MTEESATTIPTQTPAQEKPKPKKLNPLIMAMSATGAVLIIAGVSGQVWIAITLALATGIAAGWVLFKKKDFAWQK